MYSLTKIYTSIAVGALVDSLLKTNETSYQEAHYFNSFSQTQRYGRVKIINGDEWWEYFHKCLEKYDNYMRKKRR